MADRWLPRAEADRLIAELRERIRRRVLAELAPLGVQLFRHSGCSDAEIQRRWDAAVLRLMAEELALTLREQRGLEVEGSA
jgi:hypothetical protein